MSVSSQPQYVNCSNKLDLEFFSTLLKSVKESSWKCLGHNDSEWHVHIGPDKDNIERITVPTR